MKNSRAFILVLKNVSHIGPTTVASIMCGRNLNLQLAGEPFHIWIIVWGASMLTSPVMDILNDKGENLSLATESVEKCI